VSTVQCPPARHYGPTFSVSLQNRVVRSSSRLEDLSLRTAFRLHYLLPLVTSHEASRSSQLRIFVSQCHSKILGTPNTLVTLQVSAGFLFHDSWLAPKVGHGK
jgi:hypothetical protein